MYRPLSFWVPQCDPTLGTRLDCRNYGGTLLSYVLVIGGVAGWEDRRYIYRRYNAGMSHMVSGNVSAPLQSMTFYEKNPYKCIQLLSFQLLLIWGVWAVEGALRWRQQLTCLFLFYIDGVPIWRRCHEVMVWRRARWCHMRCFWRHSCNTQQQPDLGRELWEELFDVIKDIILVSDNISGMCGP